MPNDQYTNVILRDVERRIKPDAISCIADISDDIYNEAADNPLIKDAIARRLNNADRIAFLAQLDSGQITDLNKLHVAPTTGHSSDFHKRLVAGLNRANRQGNHQMVDDILNFVSSQGV